MSIKPSKCEEEDAAQGHVRASVRPALLNCTISCATVIVEFDANDGG